jgi:hypothetical protein
VTVGGHGAPWRENFYAEVVRLHAERVGELVDRLARRPLDRVAADVGERELRHATTAVLGRGVPHAPDHQQGAAAWRLLLRRLVESPPPGPPPEPDPDLHVEARLLAFAAAAALARARSAGDG